jgi:radical SAM superfamily enzyme YgiQ (UPF0313 family)
MKITFVQYDVYDYVGLMQLAAVVEYGGHECSVIVDFSDAAILRRLRADPPDMVGMTCSAGVSRADAERLCALVKKEMPAVRTIIGGAYPTLYPDIFENKAFDFMCRGEGEVPLVELARALDNGTPINDIPNIYSRNGNDGIIANELRPLMDDLDDLPLPERRHHYAHAFLRNQRRKNFIATRGCPFNCSYCYVSAMREIYKDKGTFVRTRSPVHLVSEIKYVKTKYGMKYVGFMDDSFPTDAEWLAPFSTLYRREIGLPFIAAARAEALSNERIQLLAEAGCDIIGIGVESASESLRAGVLDRRGGDNEQLVSVLRAAREAGMRLLTFNMLGIPGETEEDGWGTIALNASVGAQLPRFTVLTPSPGLKIARAAEEMNLCTETDIRASSTYLKKSVLKIQGIESLVRLQKIAFLAVRYPRLNRLWRLLVRRAPEKLLDFLYLASNGFMFLDINKWSIPFTIKYGRTVSRWYE